MAGSSNSKEKLNNTLNLIIKIITELKLKNWFIGYGTLLGIIRENSCIDGDDDIDILCDINYYSIIKNALESNNLSLTYPGNSNKIIKTKATNEYASIDIYMCNIDNKGNFNDMWEKVIWSNCYDNNELLKREWNGITLQIPNNYIKKLENRYGVTWNIKQNNKGPRPPKLIL
jgi:phosphorylcholine metabolism protein LicD